MTTSLVKDMNLQHGKFKVSLPSNAYNSFVLHNNFKGSLDIGYVSHADEHVETTQTGTTGEKFLIQLNEKRHYCNTFVRESDIKVDIKGVKYSQNREIVRESVGNHSAGSYIAHDYTGLPHAYLPGMFGTVCDPMNAMSTVNKIEFNMLTETINLNQSYVNIYRKSTDMDVLQNGRYKSLLWPETLNLESLELPANKFQCLPFVPVLNKWYFKAPNITDVEKTEYFAYISKNDRTNKKKCVLENILTLEDINEIPTNMLSYNKRGKIFEEAEYTFTKSLPSHNYKFTFKDLSDITETVFCQVERYTTTPSTELFTMKIGMYKFPTNVANWQECLNNGISVYDLFYYYDKIGFLKEKKTPKDDPILTTDFINLEPDNQSINITIKFPEMRTPMIHTTFSDNYNSSFTHIKQITIENDAANINKIFKLIGTSSIGLKHVGFFPDGTNSIAELKDQKDGDMRVSIDNVKKSKLYYRSFNMDGILETYTKNQSVIPCRQIKPTLKSFSTKTQAHTNLAKRQFSKVTVHSDAQTFSDGGVPQYVLIYTDIPLQCKFTRLSVSYNNPTDHQALNLDTLRTATIRNGLYLYNENDENRYLFKSNNSPSYLSSNMSAYSQRMNGKGSVLLLKFGTDLILNESVAPGLQGNTTQLRFVVDMDVSEELVGFTENKSGLDMVSTKYRPGDNVDGILYFTYIYDKDLVVKSDATVLSSIEMTAADIVQAYKEIVADVSENTYYSNRVTGSGVLDVAKKAAVIIPKVIKTANTLKKIHDSGAIQQGITDIQKMNSKIAAYVNEI